LLRLVGGGEFPSKKEKKNSRFEINRGGEKVVLYGMGGESVLNFAKGKKKGPYC